MHQKNVLKVGIDEPDSCSISSKEDEAEETSDNNCDDIRQRIALLKRATSEPSKKNSDDDPVEEAYKIMQTVLETINQRDDFSIYGENLANRMRNATKNSRAIAVAKNKIDNILFSLEMGEFQELQSPIPMPLKEPYILVVNDPESACNPKAIKYDPKSPQSLSESALPIVNGKLVLSSQRLWVESSHSASNSKDHSVPSK